MSAKDLIVRPIPRPEADAGVKRWHYSGTVVNNSQVHLGVYWHGALAGVMQFGPSLDKRKLRGLVSDTPWNGFVELNRMAFSDDLPRNSESRAIAVAMRILRRHAPHVQWVVSFADGTQCGDGTIYRASGFVLTKITRNNQIWEAPDGARFSRTSLTEATTKGKQAAAVRFCRKGLTSPENPGVQRAALTLRRGDATKGGNILETGGASMRGFIEAGFRALPGHQLRYVYFIDPTARERLTVPIIPFAEIARQGAGMYRGTPRAGSIDGDAPAIHAGEGGSIPTSALHVPEVA